MSGSIAVGRNPVALEDALWFWMLVMVGAGVSLWGGVVSQTSVGMMGGTNVLWTPGMLRTKEITIAKRYL